MTVVTDISVTGRPSRVGRTFDLGSLFDGGAQGVWFDPSDRSTLFQDAAGTTAVTGPNQPVGRMLDKSGLGRHATQSVAAARPTYRLDSAGRAYLDFDGVDDWMGFGPLAMAGKTAATLCVAMRKTSDTATGMVFTTGTWNGPAIDLRSPGSWGGSNFGGYVQSTVGSTRIGTLTTGHAAPVSAVLTFQIDLTKSAGQEAVLRVNHVPFAQTASTSHDSTGTLAGTTAFLGRRQDAAVLLMQGRIYGVFLHSTALSQVDLQKLEFNMANKIGVAP